MPDDRSKKQVITQRIILGVCAFITLILVVFATVFILSITNKPIEKNSTIIAPSTQTVVADFSKPGAIAGLSKIYLKRSSSSKVSTIATINYKDDVNKYYITVTVDDTQQSVRYTPINKSQDDDSKTVISQTTDFMKKLYLDVDSYNPTNTDLIKYQTYSNSTLVCQLQIRRGTSDATSSNIYTLSCLNKSVFNTEYIKIDKLLGIYSKSQELPVFTGATDNSKTEGNKSYSILSLIVDSGNRYRLLFASIDDKWDYLGTLSTGTARKSTITPEIQTKMSDPKYGDFLTANIK